MTEGNSDISYAAAWDLIQEDRIDEAIAMCEEILCENHRDRAVAAYGLGILYDGAYSRNADEEKAEYYYSISESEGYAMASYRLGGLFLRQEKTVEALEKFRITAQENPSSAYWIYRILSGMPGAGENKIEAEEYLSLASRCGHIHAQKIQLLRKARGIDGFGNIPKGILGLFKLVFKSRDAIASNERVKIQ